MKNFVFKKGRSLPSDEIVEIYLIRVNRWFRKGNGFHLKRNKIKQYLLAYIEDPKTLDYDDTDLIYAANSFSDFIEYYFRNAHNVWHMPCD